MDFQELGQTIARLRREKKITQQTLADHTGISRTTLSLLEKGRASDIGVRKILKILHYLQHDLAVKTKQSWPTFEELVDERR
jgi:transcriptional regulator with XRE-family HTH domain